MSGMKLRLVEMYEVWPISFMCVEVLPGKAGVIQRGFGYASIPNSVGAFMVEGWIPTIVVKAQI